MFESDTCHGSECSDYMDRLGAISKRREYLDEEYDDSTYTEDEHVVIRAMEDIIKNKGEVII
jgi:hypothetical protein